MNLLRIVEREQMKQDVPEFRPGDTVRVHVKVVEGARQRLQPFEGVVIARRGTGSNETFTVRRVTYSIGVERTFPLHSPNVAQIEVLKLGRVRRAKLYYVRDRKGKRARIRERIRVK